MTKLQYAHVYLHIGSYALVFLKEIVLRSQIHLLAFIFSDENGFLIKKQQRKGQGQSSLQQNQAIVNWSDVLPPPPDHPPGSGDNLPEDQLYSEIPEDSAVSLCSCPVSHSHVAPGTSKSVYSDTHCNRCQSLRNFGNMPYTPRQILQHIQASRQQPYPANVARTLGSQQGSDSSSGTPVYLYGYSQPWDCTHPSFHGTLEYDYAQVPVEDAYNYTQPIQDGRIDPSNTLNKGGHRNPQKLHYGVPPGYYDGSEHSHPLRAPYRDKPHNIPAGGPPGNYCEGPSRGQVEPVDKFHRTGSEKGTHLPYLEGYKIESPPSCASEYKVVGSGSESGGGSGTSGDRKRGLTGRSSSEGNDLKQYHPDSQYRPQVIHSRLVNYTILIHT